MRAPTLAQALYPPLPERLDAAALRSAVEAYRAGDLAKGDEAARNTLDDLGRVTLEWAALRLQAKTAGYGRIATFIDKNTDWPTSGFLQSRLEDALYANKAPHALVRERFATLGMEPLGSTPEEYEAFNRKQIADFRNVVTQAGIKVE